MIICVQFMEVLVFETPNIIAIASLFGSIVVILLLPVVSFLIM